MCFTDLDNRGKVLNCFAETTAIQLKGRMLEIEKLDMQVSCWTCQSLVYNSWWINIQVSNVHIWNEECLQRFELSWTTTNQPWWANRVGKEILSWSYKSIPKVHIRNKDYVQRLKWSWTITNQSWRSNQFWKVDFWLILQINNQRPKVA